MDWGDGILETRGATGDVTHVYQDNALPTISIDLMTSGGQTFANAAALQLAVEGVAPDVRLNPIGSIDEAGTATLTGSFTDVGVLDTFTLEVNWGDPSSPTNVETITYDASAATGQPFTLTHPYQDDSPTGVFDVTVTVTDDDGVADSEQRTVVVRNVDPTITQFDVPAQGSIGAGVPLAAAATDPAGAADPLTFVWAIELLTGPNAGEGTLLVGDTVSFTPPQGGDYNVVLEVTDGDGGTTTTSAPLTVTAPPPRVTQVLVSGTAWTQDFLDELEIAGPGGRRGHAVPVGSIDQFDPLPWSAVDQVILRFSEQVNVQQSDLRVFGVRGPDGIEDANDEYAFSGFATEFGPTGEFQAIWTLSSAFGSDRVHLVLDDANVNATLTTVALDGEWTDATSTFPSGDGTVGGDFAFRFDVSPANVGRDSGVTIFDIAVLRLRHGSVAGAPPYVVFVDVNGDGMIDELDRQPLRDNLGRMLPDPPEGGTSGGGQNLVTGTDRIMTTPEAVAAAGSMDIVLDTPNGSVLPMLNYAVRVRLDGPGAGTNVALTGGGVATNAPAATPPDPLNASGNLDRLPEEYYHGTVNFSETAFPVSDGDGLIRTDYLVQPGTLGVYTFDIVVGQNHNTALIASLGNARYPFTVAAPRLIVTIPGDLNGDFRVGAADLQIILANFTQQVTTGDLTQGDITGPNGEPDGLVASDDLQFLLQRFTNSVTPPTARAAAASSSAADALALSSWQGWARSRLRDATGAARRSPLDADDVEDRVSAWFERRTAGSAIER